MLTSSAKSRWIAAPAADERVAGDLSIHLPVIATAIRTNQTPCSDRANRERNRELSSASFNLLRRNACVLYRRKSVRRRPGRKEHFTSSAAGGPSRQLESRSTTRRVIYEPRERGSLSAVFNGLADYQRRFL